MNAPPRQIPLAFLGMPFGLLGLADCWLVAAKFGQAPVAIGRALGLIAVLVWVIVLAAHIRGMRAGHAKLTVELSDPTAGPFGALAVIVPMLAAADLLYPLSHAAGSTVVDVLIVATMLLSGWFTGNWIYRPLEFAKLHPGYFLPSVAGGLVASASAGLVGQTELAQLLFGLGLLAWIVLGSIILGRLVVGPPLPNPLVPTIAIEVAPAGVATFAWFVIDGGRLDTVVRIIGGYGLMMVIAQLRLLPAYRRLPFMPSFWAFTFSGAAVTFSGLFWLGIARPDGWRVESYVMLALITTLIGAIAVRTVIAISRRELLPVPGAAAAAAPSVLSTASEMP
jgi:tellurite resistance protein